MSAHELGKRLLGEVVEMRMDEVRWRSRRDPRIAPLTHQYSSYASFDHTVKLKGRVVLEYQISIRFSAIPTRQVKLHYQGQGTRLSTRLLLHQIMA